MTCLSEIRSSTYREKLEDFINAYRLEPCLWQIKNINYFNRNERYAAMDRLLVTYRKLVPTAQREDIQKKINSLRTVYKKERQKVKTAKQAGETRVPKLWCYSLMSFIDKDVEPGEDYQEEVSDHQEDEGKMETVDIKEEVDDYEEAIEHATISTYHSDAQDPSIPRAKKPRTNSTSQHINDTLHSDGHSEGSSGDIIKHRDRRIEEIFEEEDEGNYTVIVKEEFDNNDVPMRNDHAIQHSEVSIEIPNKKLNTYSLPHHSKDTLHSNDPSKDDTEHPEEYETNPRDEHRTEDRHDVYCKSIAYKLRYLPKQQRLLAEKLINDVLFEAEWGSLTLTHRLTQ